MAFGGVEIGRTERPDGTVANLQVRIGSVTLMVSEASPAYPPMPAAFCLYVDDADASTERAVAAGATPELDVMDMPYDNRKGGVRYPFGNVWWISQRLVDRPYH